MHRLGRSIASWFSSHPQPSDQSARIKHTNRQKNQPQKNRQQQSLKALDRLNLSLGDVRDVFEPYLTIFLAADRHLNQAQIGVAIAVTNIAGILAQTPVGALVDASRYKRLLVAVSLLAIAISYGFVVGSALPMVIAAQAVIGVATVTITPALNAISLGLVGKERLEARVGRNEVFNRFGNVVTAVIAGTVGLFVGRSWIFALLILLCLISVFVVYQIRNGDINQAIARADDEVKSDETSNSEISSDTHESEQRSSLKDLLRDRKLRNFGLAVVFFYLANAVLLPLVSQELIGGQKNASSATSVYVSGCIVLSQLVMIPVTGWVGKNVDRWGSKPLSLIAFSTVLLRALLCTLNKAPWYLVAVQGLDGIASGIFTVLIVVIVADLTQGTGRFNLAQGMVQTLVGVGAAFSNLAIGFLAKAAGYNTGFFSVAVVAAIGLGWYWFAVPETKPAS
jgi:MFS family permease